MTVTTTITASSRLAPTATPTTMPTIVPPNGCSSASNVVDISCSVVPASVDCIVVADSLEVPVNQPTCTFISGQQTIT